MPDRNFAVNIVISARNLATQALQSFGDHLKKLASPANMVGAVMDGITNSLMGMAANLGQTAKETFAMGVQVEAVERRFMAFAGGAQQGQLYLDAFAESTDGAVDRMGAMQSAGKLLQMQLVDNADEMGMVASIATKLGDQTMGASDRISDFALMMANQSIPRLDNFGISSGRVRQKIEQLMLATKGLTREEAFKIAVMEEGRKALDILGDTSDTTATQIAKITAAVKDAQTGIGELMVSAVKDMNVLGVTMDNLDDKIRYMPEELRQIGMLWNAILAADQAGGVLRWNDAMEAYNQSLRSQIMAQMEFNTVAEESRYKQIALADETSRAAQESRDAAQYQELLALDLGTSQTAFDQYTMAVQMSMDAQDAAAVSTAAWAREQELLRQATIQNAQAAFDLSLAWTDMARQNAETQEQYEADRQRTIDESNAKVLELQKRGQAKWVQVDVAAEQEKLEAMQTRLAIALQQQAEFTDKTKESSRMAKDAQIATLQQQIAEQEAVLAAGGSGLKQVAGENVNALIAEEERRRDESLTIMDEQMAAQEEMQRQALGRMLLQTMITYAQMKGVSAEQMLEMQLAISTEYGLIDEKAAESSAKWIEFLSAWAGGADVSVSNFASSMDRADASVADFQAKLAAIPKDLDVNVRINQIGDVSEDMARRAGMGQPAFTEMQHGFNGIVGPGFGGPVRALIGEGLVPERVIVQPINQYNMAVHTRATMASVTQDFDLMRSRR